MVAALEGDLKREVFAIEFIRKGGADCAVIGPGGDDKGIVTGGKAPETEAPCFIYEAPFDRPVCPDFGHND